MEKEVAALQNKNLMPMNVFLKKAGRPAKAKIPVQEQQSFWNLPVS